MMKSLYILGGSLILSGVLLSIGRWSSINDELVSVIYYGILAVGFVIYAMNTIKDHMKDHNEEL